MGSKVATSLWKDEGWYLWHVWIGSSICACVHQCACTLCENVYAPEEWLSHCKERYVMFVTESWLVRCLGLLLLNLVCKSPYLHEVQLEIQMRFRILPLLTFQLSSSSPFI